MSFTAKVLGNVSMVLARRAKNVPQLLAKAVKREAQLLRTEIVSGITKQAPGGVPFEPLALSTLRRRRWQGFAGTKALIMRADLRNSIHVELSGDGANTEAAIGVFRNATGSNGQDLVNVAMIQEYGATIVMKHGDGVVVIKIPARPFIDPVMETVGAPSQVAARFLAFVLSELDKGS